MSKVICFYTRKEVTEMPATKEQGEAMIENLLKFELVQSRRGKANQELLANVISMIENNTGATRYEVMDKIYKARKA